MKRLDLLSKMLGLTLLIAATDAKAYVTEGYAWPNGNILLELQLGVPDNAPLTDGSKTWDDVALAAIDLWNPVLVRSRLVGVKNSTVAKAKGNSLNNVFFSSDVFGTAFGDRTLALTQYHYRGVNLVEADVVVNSGKTWDSYRGNVQTKNDLQRVLLHEFGHVLGLDHPDQAKPPQTVAAIMNSMVGNLESLQPDDIAGVKPLYAAATVPVEGSLSGQTVTAGSPLTLTYNNDTPATSYYWAFKKLGGADSDIRMLTDGDGEPWKQKTYTLFSAEEDDAGTYYVSAANFAGHAPYSTATVTINPVSKADGVLANLSTRGRAGSGNDTFIVGFVVSGTAKKSVLIRANGPSLAALGVANTLVDPKLTLMRKVGDSYVTVSENDNWSAGSAEQVLALRSAFLRLGAFALADNSTDAALLLDLEPGVYSAQVDAQGGTPGITLVEVYDADAHSDALQRPLINISTRSFAGTGEEQLFAGFVVAGNSPKQVLIRAIGPGLTKYGVTGVNSDPNLVVYKDGVHIADNDDWTYSNQGLDGILSPVFAKVGAFPLDTDKPGWDSALLITLPPGAYTAQVSGRHDETGIVLLEVYEVPE
jgi:predicted Zn-dependent protease